MIPSLPNPIPVKFLLSAEDARKTRWRWLKGDGELTLNSGQLTLTGRRWRPFLPAIPQTLTIERSDIKDVMQQGDRLYCTVALEGTKVEPLELQFTSQEIARQVAAQLPKVRSALSIEQETFNQALARTGVNVWVTPAMASICVLVFIAMVVDGVPLATPQGPELIPWGTNYGPKTLGGEPWRLYTAIFLHFGVMHLVLNVLALLSLGPLTERMLGNARFLVIYVVAGLCASMFSLLWNPDVNSAGASGAIFGVMGAYLAIMVNRRSRVPAEIAKRGRNLALTLLGVNLANSFRPGIDMAAHLGGVVAGFTLGWLFVRPLIRVDEPPDRELLPVGMVVAIGLLAALALPLFHPTEARAFKLAMREFTSVELPAKTRAQELDEMGNDKRITNEQWARRTLSEVVPLWEKVADAAFLLPSGSTREETDLVIGLRRYAQGEILMRELYAESFLEDDLSKLDDANKIQIKQQARRELMQSARERYF